MADEDVISGLSQALAGGWSNLPDLDTSLAHVSGGPDIENLRLRYETAVERFEMARKISEVFSTQLGAEVLEMYRSRTLGRIQFDPEASNPSENGFF